MNINEIKGFSSLKEYCDKELNIFMDLSYYHDLHKDYVYCAFKGVKIHYGFDGLDVTRCSNVRDLFSLLANNSKIDKKDKAFTEVSKIVKQLI